MFNALLDVVKKLEDGGDQQKFNKDLVESLFLKYEKFNDLIYMRLFAPVFNLDKSPNAKLSTSLNVDRHILDIIPKVDRSILNIVCYRKWSKTQQDSSRYHLRTIIDPPELVNVREVDKMDMMTRLMGYEYCPLKYIERVAQYYIYDTNKYILLKRLSDEYYYEKKTTNMGVMLPIDKATVVQRCIVEIKELISRVKSIITHETKIQIKDEDVANKSLVRSTKKMKIVRDTAEDNSCPHYKYEPSDVVGLAKAKYITSEGLKNLKNKKIQYIDCTKCSKMAVCIHNILDRDELALMELVHMHDEKAVCTVCSEMLWTDEDVFQKYLSRAITNGSTFFDINNIFSEESDPSTIIGTKYLSKTIYSNMRDFLYANTEGKWEALNEIVQHKNESYEEEEEEELLTRSNINTSKTSKTKTKTSSKTSSASTSSASSSSSSSSSSPLVMFTINDILDVSHAEFFIDKLIYACSLPTIFSSLATTAGINNVNSKYYAVAFTAIIATIAIYIYPQIKSIPRQQITKIKPPFTNVMKFVETLFQRKGFTNVEREMTIATTKDVVDKYFITIHKTLAKIDITKLNVFIREYDYKRSLLGDPCINYMLRAVCTNDKQLDELYDEFVLSERAILEMVIKSCKAVAAAKSKSKSAAAVSEELVVLWIVISQPDNPLVDRFASKELVLWNTFHKLVYDLVFANEESVSKLYTILTDSYMYRYKKDTLASKSFQEVYNDIKPIADDRVFYSTSMIRIDQADDKNNIPKFVPNVSKPLIPTTSSKPFVRGRIRSSSNNKRGAAVTGGEGLDKLIVVNWNDIYREDIPGPDDNYMLNEEEIWLEGNNDHEDYLQESEVDDNDVV